MKKRILFVDDEPRILEGLENLLRAHRKKWEMAFVVGGQPAKERLAAERFDVIVSDMRMPGIDGATLLRHVQEQHPDVVRIVLSGYTELEAALRAVPVAHQFLTKPCNPDILENVIERACKLQLLIGDDVVRRVVGRVEKLPSLPRVYGALTRALADEKTTAKDVARIVEQDMGMSAKILQLVNSAFLRTAQRVAKIETAVAYLGFNMVKNLALSVEVFEAGKAVGRAAALDFEALQRHSLHVANLAVALIGDKKLADDAFMAGMLHDVGKLVLAMEMPAYVKGAVEASRARAVALHFVELEQSGVSHAEVGGYLLGLWGLPYPVVEAVANHHEPTRVQQRGFDVLAAVHVANALAHEATPAEERAPFAPLDPAYLDALGVRDRLEGWRALALEQRAALHG